MAETQQPMPTGSPVTTTTIDPTTGKVADSRLMSRDWIQWFYVLVDKIARSPRVQGTASVPGSMNGPLGPTAMNLSSRNSGLYRISYYLRETAAAGGNSSVSVTFISRFSL